MDELICICTEPPSDSARRAGMSWGGVSETIRGACPLCQGEDGCPPECRSLTLTRIEEKLEEALPGLIQTGGWCAPSHEEVFGYPDPLEFPQVQIKRGGIYIPRYRVETMVQPARKRFLRRQTWNLHVRYWDPAQKRYMNHIMEGFPAENLANNAAEIMKFTIQTINEQVHQEQLRR